WAARPPARVCPSCDRSSGALPGACASTLVWINQPVHRSGAMSLHYVKQQRPITDSLRRSVTEDLPELADINDPTLRAKAVEAWAFALSHSSFGRISDIPPGGNPGMNVLKRGSQADHLRGVAKLALQIADTFVAQRPEVRIDRDVVLCGALCH